MSSYRVAIIGTGRVSWQFDSDTDLPGNHASAVASSDRFELVAGVNRGAEKLKAFGQHHHVDALYHDYREILDEVTPDICIVATHPELHREMVTECASRSSTRAIICEKPMALSLEECDAMIDACKSAGVLLQINHNRRWVGEWGLGRQLVESGAIGKLNHIYCCMDGGKPVPTWRSENEGPLLHDFTHYFDMMDMFAGEVDWLCGMAEQRERPWAVEDFGAAFIKFKSGVTGVVHAAELSEYANSAFELRGSKGVIRLESERGSLFQSEPGDYEPDSGLQWYRLAPAEVDHPSPSSPYVAALNELADVLEGKGTLRSDGEVGRRSLETVMGIYQSQLNGCQPVHFPVTLESSGVAALREAGRFAER